MNRTTVFVFVLLISSIVSCEYNDLPDYYLDCQAYSASAPSAPVDFTVSSFSAVIPPDSSQFKYTITSRTVQPLLAPTMPWESSGINWSNVLKVDGRWQMWYEAYDGSAKSDFDGYVCYAESTDGINWVKPELELVSYKGNRKNNIVLTGIHGPDIIYDESLPAESRYRMVFTRPDNKAYSWVFGMTSADGHRFENLAVLMKANSDTQPTVLVDDGRFRFYLRMWDGGQLGIGRRTIGYSESTSFGGNCIPPPREILHYRTESDRELYNSSVAKVRDDLYLMFPSVFYNKTDLSIPHIGLAKDGINFTLFERKPFLSLGAGFDSKAIYCAPGLIKGSKENEYILYYTGKSKPHSAELTQLKSSFTGGIGRVVFELN